MANMTSHLNKSQHDSHSFFVIQNSTDPRKRNCGEAFLPTVEATFSDSYDVCSSNIDRFQRSSAPRKGSVRQLTGAFNAPKTRTTGLNGGCIYALVHQGPVFAIIVNYFRQAG